MDYVTLGKTGITVNKNGFGAIPIQRISDDDAVRLVRRAYQGGITFFDTARSYGDSEKKLGLVLSDVRDKVYIATKTWCSNGDELWENLDTSLGLLCTDYVDIYQFHNPESCPKPGDGTGRYEAMLEAKAQGKVRHIGITNHRLEVAREAAESGLYETIQFPVAYLSSKEELDFVRFCGKQDIGVIAMKALAGGFITNSAAAYAFLAQFPYVLPIWGMQRESELDEFLSYQDKAPVLDDEMRRVIEADIADLGGEFCRACGYCLPCPADIEIPTSARMIRLLRRMPESKWLSDEWVEKMNRIGNCINCGHCKMHCPYNLDTPALLRKNLEDYRTFLK